jgi:hypothetical protein
MVSDIAASPFCGVFAFFHFNIKGRLCQCKKLYLICKKGFISTKKSASVSDAEEKSPRHTAENRFSQKLCQKHLELAAGNGGNDNRKDDYYGKNKGDEAEDQKSLKAVSFAFFLACKGKDEHHYYVHHGNKHK